MILRTMNSVATALTATVLTVYVFLPGDAQAADYDMDCKVILCLAGGFPSGCSDAKSYMFKRLRKGKSPFGTCTTSNGGTYNGTQVSTGRPSEIDKYACSNGADPVRYRIDTRTSWYWGYRCPGGGSLITYDLSLRVTVEPGTAQAYQSPTFLVDYHSGAVEQK